MSHDVLACPDVWVQSVLSGQWVRCSLLQREDDVCVVLVNEHGSRVRREVDSDLVVPCNDPEQCNVDNMISLPFLDEPNMLETLRVRYILDLIYTRSGHV